MKTSESLISTLREMSEIQLTRHVIMPLVRQMFPGARVEETHGPEEAGRDIICFTKHYKLRRNLVICIQVKNHRISCGSTAGPYSIATLRNQVEDAALNGVTTTGGDTITPDEVWVILTHNFSDTSRRSIRSSLQTIKKNRGTIIDGTELELLLRDHCADLVTELSLWKDKRLASILSYLTIHHESRAFGLRFDRNLDEFHVRARALIEGTWVSLFLSGGLRVEDHLLYVPTFKPLDKDYKVESGEGVAEDDADQYQHLRSIAEFTKDLKIQAEWVSQKRSQASQSQFGLAARGKSRILASQSPTVQAPSRWTRATGTGCQQGLV